MNDPSPNRRPVRTPRHLVVSARMGFLALLLGLAGGCSSGGGENGSEDVIGRFQIALIGAIGQDPAYTSVIGTVSDGPTPNLVVWEKQDAAGSCQLLTPRVPFCDPACSGGAVCVEDGVCLAYPVKQSVGTVTVKGVRTQAGAAEFAMEPVAGNYQPVGIALAYPPFSEGDAVEVSAAGSSFAPPFSLHASGISPFSLANATLPLERGQALVLSWTAPAHPALARVQVKLDISHHGGTKGMIVCEGDDAGSLEISAGLVTRLLDLGVAGFPTIVVSRVSADATKVPAGRIELLVTSQEEREVSIAGLVSCTDDSDCPQNQTCRSDLTCG